MGGVSRREGVHPGRGMNIIRPSSEPQFKVDGWRPLLKCSIMSCKLLM